MTKKRRRSEQAEEKEGNECLTQQPSHDDRCDPKCRGIHSDAILGQAHSPSGRATCVDCNQKILKDTPRWGIKYAGNPLPIPVIPLYGSHPMYLWCHSGGCGLAFIRMVENDDKAAQTCHACQDTPSTGLRLLCGGAPNAQNKIRQHAFHMKCWLRAMNHVTDKNARKRLVISPSEIGNKTSSHDGTLSWNDLTEDEQSMVQETWNEYNLE